MHYVCSSVSEFNYSWIPPPSPSFPFHVHKDKRAQFINLSPPSPPVFQGVSLQSGPALGIAGSCHRSPNPCVYCPCLPQSSWERRSTALDLAAEAHKCHLPWGSLTIPCPSSRCCGLGTAHVTPKNVGWPQRRVPKTPKWGWKQILLIPHNGGNSEEPPQGPEGPLTWDGTHRFSQLHFHSISVWREMSEEGKPTCWVPAYTGAVPVLSPQWGEQMWPDRLGRPGLMAAGWPGEDPWLVWGPGQHCWVRRGAALWWTQLAPAHSYPATPPDTLPGAGAALGKGSPGREHRSQGHGMRTALTAAWAGRETRQHEEQV